MLHSDLHLAASSLIHATTTSTSLVAHCNAATRCAAAEVAIRGGHAHLQGRVPQLHEEDRHLLDSDPLTDKALEVDAHVS